MNIFKFFDKLEDRARRWLSHRPILYSVIGSIGVVLIWRGVWYLADSFSTWLTIRGGPADLLLSNSLFLDGLISFVVGVFLLLISGLFVSQFIGNEIIISGLRGEKKLVEKTEEELMAEVKYEATHLVKIHEELKKISERLEILEKK